MNRTSFNRWVPDLADPHMAGPNNLAFYAAIGSQLDAMAEKILVGRLSSNPFAGGANPTREGAARLADGRLIECDVQALPAIADQRGITLYPTEPELSKRYRLSRWWQLHKRRGTHKGELEHVWPYFLGLATTMPVIDIVHQAADNSSATWHRIDATGTYSVYRKTPGNFDFDGTSAWWRWFAFVRMSGTGIAGPNTYDDGHTYDDGSIYDAGGLSTAQQRDIAQMFLDWQSAHSECIGVALVWGSSAVDRTSTPTQDPSGWWSLPNGAGTWAKAYNPTTHLATRPPMVQWIYEP